MKPEDIKALEEQAVTMAKAGVSRFQIESELGHEFIIFCELMTGQVSHATLWA